MKRTGTDLFLKIPFLRPLPVERRHPPVVWGSLIPTKEDLVEAAGEEDAEEERDSGDPAREVERKSLGLGQAKVQTKAKRKYDFSTVEDRPLKPTILPTWYLIAQPGPVGGRLLQYADNWNLITKDIWVLNTVHNGLSWTFKRKPPLRSSPIEMTGCRPGEERLYCKVIQDMLEQNVVEKVPLNNISNGFYSRFFLVPKRGLDEFGQPRWRSVLDLSILNKYLDIPKFRMETAESIRLQMELNEYTASIDIVDAYHHMPIHRRYRKFLRFTFKGAVYQFIAMPAGLAVAPWAFSRLLVPMRQFCHERLVVIHQYLDDWLIRNIDKDTLYRDTNFVMKLSQALGWTIHNMKSDLEPSQQFIFLGYLFDTKKGMVYPPDNRWNRLDPLLKLFLSAPLVKAKMWQKLLGCLTALDRLVPLAMVRTRPLQFHLAMHWHQASQHHSTLVPVTKQVKRVIKWWNDKRNLKVGVPFRQAEPTLILFTDASNRGWGAHIQELSTKGFWTYPYCTKHINILEMTAVLLALQHFEKRIWGKSVLIATDNSTVVSYINKQGGTHSRAICDLASDLWFWASARDITLKARHIPGKYNVLADVLSRSKEALPLEWELHPSVLKAVFRHFGIPTVDLFATKFNHKLPEYVSPVLDPNAVAVDAFSQSWDDMFAYAFPPYAVLSRVMTRIQAASRCLMVLIVPLWSSKPWFVPLMESLVQPPIALPIFKGLWYQKRHQHTGQTLKLHACLVSSDRKSCSEFRSTLPWATESDVSNPRNNFVCILRNRLLESIALTY